MRIRTVMGVMVCGGLLTGEARALPILVGDNAGVLHSVDSVTGDVTTIGPMHSPGSSTGIAMTDLAMDAAGNLFGVGLRFQGLYSINPANAEVSFIDDTGTDLIGLAFDASGTLYGTSALDGTGLYTVDTSTGAGTFVGPIIEPGASASRIIQDIAFDSNGILYGLGDKGSIVPVLFTIDPVTGDAVEIGVPLVSNPRLGLGIAFDSDDNLFVATRPGTFWSVDTTTGLATLIDLENVLAFGATSNPHPISGPNPAPEPSTVGLLGAGLAALWSFRRSRSPTGQGSFQARGVSSVRKAQLPKVVDVGRVEDGKTPCCLRIDARWASGTRFARTMTGRYLLVDFEKASRSPMGRTSGRAASPWKFPSASAGVRGVREDPQEPWAPPGSRGRHRLESLDVGGDDAALQRRRFLAASS